LIVVDASALCAVLFGEPEREVFLGRIVAGEAWMSPVNVWEVKVGAERRFGAEGPALVDELMRRLGLRVATLTPDDGDEAFRAWLRYGKGRDPAGLNLGDCFAYALARGRGAPLLWKGTDFARTDARRA
jgi:ribonuclease VapC